VRLSWHIEVAMNVVKANQDYVNKMIGDVTGMKVLLLDKDTVRSNAPNLGS